MTGRLLENPQRFGKPLLGRFAGVHTAGCRTTGTGTASTKTAAPSWWSTSALIRTRTDRSSKIP
jgi:hypothetical protein